MCDRYFVVELKVLMVGRGYVGCVGGWWVSIQADTCLQGPLVLVLYHYTIQPGVTSGQLMR